MVNMVVIDKIVGSASDIISIEFVSGGIYHGGKCRTDVVDVIYYKDVVGRLLHSRWVGDNYSEIDKDVTCFIHEMNLKQYLIILNGKILVREGDIISKLYAR